MDDDDAADVQVMSSSISDSKREDDVHEPYSSGVAFDSNYKINHPYQASVTAIGHRTVVGLEHVLDETDDYSLSRNGDGDKIPSVHQTEQSLDIEVNEPNSWDACSVSSEHETNRVLECRNTPDAGIMDLFPPELPILCNITQQMPGNNDVSIEMTFVDRDEHPWTSISIVKDHSKRFPNNSSGSKGDVSYESVIENIFTTDFSVQTALSQEECSSGVSCSEGPCKEVSSECPLPDQENMTVDKFLSDHTKNKLAHEKEASCDKPSDRKGNREHPLYFSNRKRSFSTGRNSHSRNNNLLKQCRRAISNSADRINEISHEQACFRINEISHEQACFETCIADIKMGDSVGRSCKGEVRNLLKQFTQPMDLLYPESKDFNCKNVIYDCFFMSVDDLSPSQSTNGGNQERGNESATSASPVVPHSSEDEEEAGSDVASALVTKEIKHRPIKQPTVPANVLDKQTEASDAWVFLDSEGKHQKVTQCDVNILLGGRSADSVVLESKAHPISGVHRPTRSETGAAEAPLEPLIQESLMLLSHDDCGGEQANPPRFKLERKKGDMLLYFDRHMNPVPSVRFISVDTQMVRIWRRRQDSHNDSFGELSD